MRGSLSAARTSSSHISMSHTEPLGEPGEPVSIHGRQIGWLASDGRTLTKQPPEHVERDDGQGTTRLHVSHAPGAPSVPSRTTAHTPAHVASREHRADSRTLLKQGYDSLRSVGLSDTQAQGVLAPFRELTRAAAAPREPSYMPFLTQAEYELRTGRNSGVWTTADVIARAKDLARQDASRRQTPRLPASAPRLLAAPAPETAPASAYRDTQLAWPRQPARRSLGDSLAAMHEDTARQVSDMVAAVLRQSTQQAPSPEEAPTIQTPPVLGTPATLGAPVGLPDYVLQ
jgi:hypothetical protein